MHAREDNPELLRAQELGVKIYSFPEYLYEQSKDKLRVVIGGSHGKTTITSMVMHVINACGLDFDYMVGSQIEGFETMVKITEEAKMMVLEGDEYLSSPIDPRPKFHLYKPHVALLTGIAWDHMNVFPTFENYLGQFSRFIEMIQEEGKLYYYRNDPYLQKIVGSANHAVKTVPYEAHPHRINSGGYLLQTTDSEVPVSLIGNHNMQNIQGAKLICTDLGITEQQFYDAIRSFRGAARRQQLLAESRTTKIYLDFAHAPSKVRSTVEAFREAYPGKQLIACLELHTFSSLNKKFLPEYNGSLEGADVAMVFFNPEVVEHKRLPPLSRNEVKRHFGDEGMKIYNDSGELTNDLLSMDIDNTIVLIMTSGNFSGVDLPALAAELVNK
jgi:UDP-N-acetylmuramate: L-alanyl-gamma-D-glutamyl-meso-diaminopimelate ligase